MKVNDRIEVKVKGVWYQGVVDRISEEVDVSYIFDDGSIKKFSFIFKGYENDTQVRYNNYL